MSRFQAILKTLTALFLAAPIALSGCGSSEPAAQGDNKEPSDLTVHKAVFKPDARLAQSFIEATISDPPEGEQRPPEVTAAGKSVGKLYEQIVGKSGVGGLWDSTSFYSADGKRLQFTAKVDTELGPITMELWPDIAPNHVRNFIMLARAGYYDGLSFDRIVKQPAGDGVSRLELVTGGCPLGTGEQGFGSIGYWLKPEVSDKVTHEPGTVGAWHGDTLESAACKFYITLNKAPFMDGYWTAFGKVTGGLDLAKKILDRPNREGMEDRPREPVIIRKIVIQSPHPSPSPPGGEGKGVRGMQEVS